MRILITNDDGIRAPILPLLAQKLARIAEVTVVAPQFEQSGQSQAIEFRRRIEIKPYALCEGVEAYAMDSTPTDCVRFGIVGLGRSYDLVISGINRGYNLGDDIAYSGTVGAIMEGARLGIPGLSLSSSPDAQEAALAALDTVFDFIREKGFYRHALLYNVNIPPAIRGFAITRQGGEFFTDEFVRGEDGLYSQIGEPSFSVARGEDTDIGAIQRGLVSITPLTFSRTDLGALKALNA